MKLSLLIFLCFQCGLANDYKTTEYIMELIAKVGVMEGKLEILQQQNLHQRNECGCEKICSANLANQTPWKPYQDGNDGFYAEIDISHCGFIKTPAIFSSLGGQLLIISIRSIYSVNI